MIKITLKRSNHTITVKKVSRSIKLYKVGRPGATGETGPQGPQGIPGSAASNLVQSVNGKQGAVVLNSTDIGADASGSASSALTQANDFTVARVNNLDSELATVAKTGSYNDLLNKPTIPTVPVTSVNGRIGAVTGLAEQSALTSGLALKADAASTTTALNAKVDKVVGKQLSTEDYTSIEKTKLSGIQAGAQVNTVTSVASKTGAVTLVKADVGLNNVDNTSDISKPISTATQSALNVKQDTLVSGTNIKTINGSTLLGSGDLVVSGGGDIVYTAVVPDDYPTLSQALAALPDNSSVFVKPGTYTETGGTFATVRVSIHGAGAGATTLVLSNDLTLTSERVTLKDIAIDTNSGKKLTLSGQYNLIQNISVNNGTVTDFFSTGLFNGVSNNTIIATSSSGTIKFGERNRITSNHITVPHTANGGIYLSFHGVFTGNFVYRYQNAQGFAAGPLIYAWGERCSITGNEFFAGLNDVIATDFRCSITGNSIFQAARNVITTKDGGVVSANAIHLADTGVAIFVSGRTTGYSTVVNGNNISDSGSFPGTQAPQPGHVGVRVGNDSVRTIITANSIAGVQIGVDVAENAVETLISDNGFTYITTGVADAGIDTVIVDNRGITNDPSSNLVTSVNTKQGAVVLDSDDIGTYDQATIDSKDQGIYDTVSIELGQYYTKNEADGTFVRTEQADEVSGYASVNPSGKVTLLNNVDNTSDLSKPISTATQTALNAKGQVNSIVAGTKITVDSTNPVSPIVNADPVLPSDLGINATGQRVPVSSSTTAWTASLVVNQTATASTIAQRKTGGTLSVGTPTLDSDAATKLYVDGIGATKQDTLVSATNIKTVNGNSLLGSGDLTISGGGGTGDYTFISKTAPAYTPGLLYWDSTEDALTFYNSDSNIALNLGQEQYIKVTNNSGANIANGVPVILNGALAGVPTIALAGSTTLALSRVIGLTTEPIANGASGYVAMQGKVRNLDTSTFTVGAILYLGSTAGTITATMPSASSQSVTRIGRVLTQNATTGVIVLDIGQGALSNLQSATTDLGTVLSNNGLRTSGTAYTITTSGATNLTGSNTFGGFTVTGGIREQPATITATSTLNTSSPKNQRVTASTAAINITLPATTTAGFRFRFYRTDATAQVVTILGTFNGNAAGYVLSAQYKYVDVMSTTVSGAYEIWGNN